MLCVANAFQEFVFAASLGQNAEISGPQQLLDD